MKHYLTFFLWNLKLIIKISAGIGLIAHSGVNYFRNKGVLAFSLIENIAFNKPEKSVRGLLKPYNLSVKGF